MYAVTSCLLESLTLATFLRAEFGFLGVIVLTESTTALLKGEGSSLNFLSLALNQRRREAVLVFFVSLFLPFLISCYIVGINNKPCILLLGRAFGQGDGFLLFWLRFWRLFFRYSRMKDCPLGR